jgi:hypothetical protein
VSCIWNCLWNIRNKILKYLITWIVIHNFESLDLNLDVGLASKKRSADLLFAVLKQLGGPVPLGIVWNVSHKLQWNKIAEKNDNCAFLLSAWQRSCHQRPGKTYLTLPPSHPPPLHFTAPLYWICHEYTWMSWIYMNDMNLHKWHELTWMTWIDMNNMNLLE